MLTPISTVCTHNIHINFRCALRWRETSSFGPPRHPLNFLTKPSSFSQAVYHHVHEGQSNEEGFAPPKRVKKLRGCRGGPNEEVSRHLSAQRKLICKLSHFWEVLGYLGSILNHFYTIFIHNLYCYFLMPLSGIKWHVITYVVHVIIGLSAYGKHTRS